MNSRAKRAVGALAAVLVLGLILTTMATGWVKRDPEQVEGAAPTWSTVPANDVAEDVAEALAALETDPAALVPAAQADEIGGQIRVAIPEGSVVRADPSTWTPDGLGGGVIQVQVTPPNQPSTTYLAVMAPEEGKWKVLSTMLVE